LLSADESDFVADNLNYLRREQQRLNERLAAPTKPDAQTLEQLSRRQAGAAKETKLSVPLVVRMTATGYDAEVLPAWENFPTEDLHADTARMNSHLQTYIDTMPAQYYWVHKRFKDRPEGEPSVY